MELFDLLLRREVIVGLAIVGAVIATIGSFMMKRDERASPRAARLMLRVGYGLTGISIALFIAAGFSGR